MNEEAAFLRAIADNPDDDTARLAFGDWLEERDDPRGPLVRDKDVWLWMRPDAKDPTEKLLTAVRRRQWHAGIALGKMGHRVIPRVLEALPTVKEAARHRLWWVLEHLGPSAEPAVPLLLEATRHADPSVRLGAYHCLGGLILTNDDALRAVLAALDGSDTEARKLALMAFYNHAERSGAAERFAPAIPALRKLLTKDEPTSFIWAASTLEKLGAVDETLVSALAPLLNHGQMGHAAVYALRSAGLPAVRALLEAAKDLTNSAIWRTAEVLESLCKTPEARQIVREALQSPHPGTRQMAANVLSRLPAEPRADTVPGLIEALRSEEPTRVMQALDAVCRLGPAAADALPALLELLRDPKVNIYDWRVSQALRALGPAAEPAVPDLLEIVARGAYPSAETAALPLYQLGYGPNAVVVLLAGARAGRSVGQTLNNISIGATGDFAGLRDVVYREYNDRPRGHPMLGVARLAVAKRPDVAKIATSLSDDLATRIVAVFALRHVGTPEAATALLPALKDKDKLVRTHVVRALGRIGRNVEGVADAVRGTLKDRAKDVRAAAEEALARLTPEPP